MGKTRIQVKFYLPNGDDESGEGQGTRGGFRNMQEKLENNFFQY